MTLAIAFFVVLGIIYPPCFIIAGLLSVCWLFGKPRNEESDGE